VASGLGRGDHRHEDSQPGLGSLPTHLYRRAHPIGCSPDGEQTGLLADDSADASAAAARARP